LISGARSRKRPACDASREPRFFSPPLLRRGRRKFFTIATAIASAFDRRSEKEGPPSIPPEYRGEAGTARINDLGGTPSTDYYHTDMLGTTRFLTDASGGEIEPAVYTAFGELVSGTSGRFGYVGAHGYQTATSDTPGDPYTTDMTYQHVGARYYDPTTGRFLQRDPIGIADGLNVYLYAEGNPTVGLDPFGLAAVPLPPAGYPEPPGYDPSSWEWVPNKNPNPSAPQDPGHYEDPSGNKWRLHPEDSTHNPHWDKIPRKGPHERIPVDPNKPVFKPSTPTWYDWILF